MWSPSAVKSRPLAIVTECVYMWNIWTAMEHLLFTAENEKKLVIKRAKTTKDQDVFYFNYNTFFSLKNRISPSLVKPE